MILIRQISAVFVTLILTFELFLSLVENLLNS